MEESLRIISKHSEKLLVMVDSLLKNLRMDIGRDGCLRMRRTGSFPGLRIAQANKEVTMVLNKPLLPCQPWIAWRIALFI